MNRSPIPERGSVVKMIVQDILKAASDTGETIEDDGKSRRKKNPPKTDPMKKREETCKV